MSGLSRTPGKRVYGESRTAGSNPALSARQDNNPHASIRVAALSAVDYATAARSDSINVQEGKLKIRRIATAFAFAATFAGTAALAQSCPEKNIMYWQAFPAGGESDISARHQQAVLKKHCPKIETIVQYKPGAGGGLMWAQMNTLPADGYNIVGINLPHIVLQPLEGQVQYKTDDITPTYWFHYTPDAIVVPEQSPIKTFADLIRMAKAKPGEVTLAGSGTNSANHAAAERLNIVANVKTTYVPFKGTGDLTTAVLGQHVTGAMSYSAFAINNKGKVRAIAIALDKRHPLLPDVPTFKELGFNWIDGAYRGIGMPKSTPPEARKRMSDLWAKLNNDPEMKELAAKSGFELINIGIDRMGPFMAERTKAYTEVAKRLGLGKQ
jgi:tripartite-type tricarboxylate transporter receptor subunit TctC